MTVTMPTDLTFGHVVGLFLLGVADTADPGRLPDPKAAVGLIGFSSRSPVEKTTSPPALIGKQNVDCSIDAEGYLVDPMGARGVWLFSGVWTVKYQIVGLAIQSHDIEVLSTHTELNPLDLVQALPAGTPIEPSQYAELSARISALEGGGGGGGGFVVSDSPTKPVNGKSATYWVTSAVSWPAGIVWSDDPDAGVAPTIASAALVSLVTVDGTTYGVAGATFTVPAPPDTTAPTAGSIASSSVTASGFTLTFSGASDETALHASPYAFSLDNGGTWTPYQSAAAYAASGLTASTAYTCKGRVRDAAGNTADTAALVVTTSAAGDTTPPTVGSMAASAITSSGFTLTVTGATDETALDAAPYAFTTDNGATWTAYQASNVYNATGLTASTAYTCNWRVRDAAGNVSTGTSISVTTGAGASLTIAWAADGAQVNNPGLSYTWTALAIGAESATRRVAVMVASYLNATPNSYVTAVTIGGVTATRDAATPDTAIRTLEIWTANVPTGTTADVVVTFAASPANAAVSTYAIDGAASTPGSAGTAYGSGVSNATASVTGAAGGLVLATSMVVASGQTVTWTGDVALTRTTSSANLTRSAATVATTDTSVKTATATWSGINPTVTVLAVVPL